MVADKNLQPALIYILPKTYAAPCKMISKADTANYCIFNY